MDKNKEMVIRMVAEQTEEVKNALRIIKQEEGDLQCRRALIGIYALHLKYMCGSDTHKIDCVCELIKEVLRK